MLLISQDSLPINPSPIHPFFSPIVHREPMTVSPLTPPSWSISLGKRGRLNLHLMTSTGTGTCHCSPVVGIFIFFAWFVSFVWSCMLKNMFPTTCAPCFLLQNDNYPKITSALIVRRFSTLQMCPYRPLKTDTGISNTTDMLKKTSMFPVESNCNFRCFILKCLHAIFFFKIYG